MKVIRYKNKNPECVSRCKVGFMDCIFIIKEHKKICLRSAKNKMKENFSIFRYREFLIRPFVSMTRDVREDFKLKKTHSTLHKIKFDYGVLILKAYKIFSVHTIRVKFENKTNTAAESLESSPREA